MKYAIQGPLGAINRISDTEPDFVVENATVVEITDEQASTVQAGRESYPKQLYAIENGELVDFREYLKQQNFLDQPLGEAKVFKVSELANARYQEEVSGFTISGTGTALDGAFIRTDREVSQAKITQGAIAATINPAYTTDWQMADGSIVTLDANAILLISTKFSEFEQAGRTKFKTLKAQVDAATTVEELAAMTW